MSAVSVQERAEDRGAASIVGPEEDQSKESVAAAIANSTAAVTYAYCTRSPTSTSAITNGVSATRRYVKPFSAERLAHPGVSTTLRAHRLARGFQPFPGAPQELAHLSQRCAAVPARRRRARASDREVHRAHGSLTSARARWTGLPSRAQRTRETELERRRVGVAGELTTNADPSSTSVGRLHGHEDRAQARRVDGVGERADPHVPAIRGQHVISELGCANEKKSALSASRSASNAGPISETITPALERRWTILRNRARSSMASRRLMDGGDRWEHQRGAGHRQRPAGSITGCCLQELGWLQSPKYSAPEERIRFARLVEVEGWACRPQRSSMRITNGHPPNASAVSRYAASCSRWSSRCRPRP